MASGPVQEASLPNLFSSGTCAAANSYPNRDAGTEKGDTKDYTPLIVRNQTNGLSQAEGVRDQIYNLFENAAAELHVELLLLKSPPFTSPPWVRVECWLRHPQDSAMTLRSSAEVTIRPREFHRFPIEIDLTISDSKQRRTWLSIISFSSSDAKDVLSYLLCERKSCAFNFRRCRVLPIQLWRPLNKPARIGHDPVSIVTWILFVVGFVTLSFGVGIILILSGFIVNYFGKKRRRHVISSGKPSQEPRNLIRLDSWQTLVWGLGQERGAVAAAVEKQLSSVTDSGFTISNERIWYWGIDGKEERVQLVARFQRAIAFIHIYSYGEDLFVGWDAHVNGGTWVEKVAGVGYDKNTFELCAIHTITAGWQVPTEYDITDANCLLERVHAAVAKVVRIKVAEHHIDQEIDFRIQREERQGVAGRQQPETGAVTGGFKKMLSKFRRVG